jgi:flavin-dependent dehydrogenase
MDSFTSERFDVAIVGAGPAGCSAGLQLARAGASVVIIEKRSSFQRRLGETLPPVISKVLRTLKLWEDFLQIGPVPSSCNASAWGSSDLTFNDFLFDVEGQGWHTDRGQLERMLAQTVENAGAKLHLGSRVRSCTRTGANWLLEIMSGVTTKYCRAEFLIDASGRSPINCKIGRGRRLVCDYMIAVGVYVLVSAMQTAYSYTLVEAIDEGWFYSAQLGPRDAVICYMTDADLYAHGRRRSQQYWREQLGKAIHTKYRFGEFQIACDPFFAAANTSVRTPVIAQNWMAIGDAAISFDPLSSSGINDALRSGVHAAEAVVALKGGKAEALDDWCQSVRTAFSSFLIARKKIYEIERRWMESPFWKRRQSSPSTGGNGARRPEEA